MRRGLLWTALFAGWGARGNEVGASRMSRIGSRMAAGSIVAIAALLCAGGCKQSDPVQAELDPYSSFVSKTGDIGFPANFPSGFVFIGSWAVTGDGGVADIHSVYARPIDVVNFNETGRFLDGAVLVKEVTLAVGSKHTTGNAFWANETKTWFLMVKDANERFPSNPLWGDGWGWAEFDPATKKQISTNYQADCKGCHVPAMQSDWVYSYAYPALGPNAQATVPKDIIVGEPEAGAARHGGAVAQETGSDAVDVAQDTGSDVAAGKVTFEIYCSSCHSMTPGENGIGPSLAGVAGRKAGTSAGYAYSPAMSSSEVIWTAENLASHIEKPKELIPGNRMGGLFPRGVQDAKKRGEIVAYLLEAR